jgi:hypothetical protein
MWMLACAAALVGCLMLATPSQALVVTRDLNAMNLATAIAAPGTGMSISGATLVTAHVGVNQAGAEVGSAGTYTNASGTYGLAAPGGVILSSGGVEDYADGPNTDSSFTTIYGVAATPAQEALLDPITGGGLDHNDVTQLDLTFDMDADHDTAFFQVVWGSEEYDEWIGSPFIDAFGIYLNGVNIAFASGLPVNVDHPDMMGCIGTELDGVLAPNCMPVMTFSGFVGANTVGNTLTFIIADSGDHSYDSTVYIQGLGGENPDVIPEPATMSLMLLGLGFVGARYRRRRQ